MRKTSTPPKRKQAVGTRGSTAGSDSLGSTSSVLSLDQQFQNLTIGRKCQRRIGLTLAYGSITDVDSRAYVLGVFRNVAPSGAAKAIDQRLDGAITEYTARRMFSGDVGAVFTVPAGRNQLPADMVLFAGLGPFDCFNSDVQQLVAENAIRLLVRSRVDELATVLIGVGSGQSAATALQHLLIGFFRGLKDADRDHRFRSITFCETNPTRFGEMKSELYRLAGTSLFGDMEVTLNETTVPPTARPSARVLEPGEEPVYAIVRQEGQSGDRLHYRVSVLGSGMKAAVITKARDVDGKKLAALLEEFDKAMEPQNNFNDVQQFGKQFSELVLPSEIGAVLKSMKDRHLVIVHDAEAGRVPWETLAIDGWLPAVTGGMSRRYLADNLPLATWLEERRTEPSLNLLLVVNPLGDLKGTEKESNRIERLAGMTPGIQVTPIKRKEATKSAILTALRTGKYDCVHYAGHAFFDAQNPGRSGLICAGEEVLSGSDLTGISNLPSLVFFNACEA